MSKQGNNTGITLIALVVTIIVLIILAGVTIQLIFGSGGIINQTQKAVIMWNEAEQNEINMLGEIESYFDSGEGIAKIETTYYPTVQAAVDAVPTTNALTKIDLLANAEEYYAEEPYTNTIAVEENKNIELNLNNFDLPFELNNSGDIKIKNGKFGIEEFYGTISNDGNIIFENVDVTGIIGNNGSIEVYDGTVELPYSYIMDNAGTFIAENVILKAMVSNNGGNVKLKNVTMDYYPINQQIDNNGGYVEILDGCKFISRDMAYVITNREGSNVKIMGENIEITATSTMSAIRNNGEMEISGSVLVKNTRSGALSVVDNNSAGVLNIAAGVTITGEANNVISNYGILNMTGGSVINTRTTMPKRAINNSSGTVTISSSVITSPENYGVITIVD